MGFSTPSRNGWLRFIDPVNSSPMESGFPDGGLLLRKKVLDWTQETGLVPSVHVSVHGKIYNLHMQPLIQKCRYFKFHLLSSPDSIELPWNFPGGSDAFERVGLFIYKSSLPFDPSSIVAIRCAAEFLGMTENLAAENLCLMAEFHLNEVILQGWDATFTVLKSCQPHLALADELLIVSRCVESISFTVCMEILHPEHPTAEEPVATIFQRLQSEQWSSDQVRELAINGVVWMKDLLLLPFEFFRRVINSLRMRGMREVHVVPIIALYVNRWVLSSSGGGDRRRRRITRATSLVLEGIIDLLLLEECEELTGTIIPVGFYFTLLAKATSFRIREEYKVKLRDRIVALLHLARFEDLLLLGEEKEVVTSPEIEAVESIFSRSDGEERGGRHERRNSNERAEVADLWDRYLSRIATSSSPEMGSTKFHQLIRVVPAEDRRNHDLLYRAIDTFFLGRAGLTGEEKRWICRLISCRKLSEEVCVEAIRNDRMPIRLVIRVLFAQQLSTHEAFRMCSSSPLGHALLSSSTMESREGRVPLGSLMLKDIALRRLGLARDEYESARMKIEMLEDELASLKESVEWKEEVYGRNGTGSTTTTAAAAAAAHVQVTGGLGSNVTRRRKVRVRVGARGCAASLTWILRRRFAVKLVGVLRRMGRHSADYRKEENMVI